MQGHLRTVEASRSISNITVGFFHSLDVHASKLTSILEETQGVQDQQLIDLEKKFEVIPNDNYYIQYAVNKLI